MSFELALFLLFIVGFVCWCWGYSTGHEDGAEAGWDAGYDFAAGDSEIRWRLTATGEAALDAPREPLADLKLHPGFDGRLPTAPELAANFPGVSFNPDTRQFE